MDAPHVNWRDYLWAVNWTQSMNSINACFISYRHSGDPNADKYVLNFKNVLVKHLSAIMSGAKVFLDQQRLGVGEFFNPQLASELCRSACMVMFYSPCHFDASSPYCGLEYHAMLDLETERRAKAAGLGNLGLIFPVILRGASHLPSEIRDQRECLDLDRLVICERDFQTRQCEKLIKKLAEQIFDCYRHQSNAGIFTQRDCNQFKFRDKESIQDWLKSVSPINRFPGH